MRVSKQALEFQFIHFCDVHAECSIPVYIKPHYRTRTTKGPAHRSRTSWLTEVTDSRSFEGTNSNIGF